MTNNERKLANLGFPYAEGCHFMAQIQWGERWINLFPCNTQDNGEWQIAQWKQVNKCMGDPFRVIPVEDV